MHSAVIQRVSRLQPVFFVRCKSYVVEGITYSEPFIIVRCSSLFCRSLGFLWWKCVLPFLPKAVLYCFGNSTERHTLASVTLREGLLGSLPHLEKQGGGSAYAVFSPHKHPDNLSTRLQAVSAPSCGGCSAEESYSSCIRMRHQPSQTVFRHRVLGGQDLAGIIQSRTG